MPEFSTLVMDRPATEQEASFDLQFDLDIRVVERDRPVNASTDTGCYSCYCSDNSYTCGGTYSRPGVSCC